MATNKIKTVKKALHTTQVQQGTDNFASFVGYKY